MEGVVLIHRPSVKFLMYRVELKVLVIVEGLQSLLPVPNVPCGVERTLTAWSLTGSQLWFLMYRVELKDGSSGSKFSVFTGS